MRAVIAFFLLFGLVVAGAPRAAHAAEPLRYGPLPIERQIEVLADAGAVDDLTARALRRRGLWAARVGDRVTMEATLFPLAEAGDQEAIFALADAATRRDALRPAVSRIERWLEPFIEAGDFEAVRLSTMIGLRHIDGREQAIYDAMARLQPGVDAGHAPSMRSLGVLHLHPRPEYRRSFALGEELLERAIALGDAEAAGELGEAYRLGRLGVRLFQGSNAEKHYRKSMALGGSRKALRGLAALTPDDHPYERFAYAKRVFEEYGSLEASYRWADTAETSWDFLQMVHRGAWDGFQTAAWFLADYYTNRFKRWRPPGSEKSGRILTFCNFVRGAGWTKIATGGLRVRGGHPYYVPKDIDEVLALAKRFGGFEPARVEAAADALYAWFQAGDPAATDGLECPPIAPVAPFVWSPP
ncbi:MAG: hypothetical protein RIB45_14240 [Marivibrio sp.]|uniref:hypothetical protein n=1 Tax=Marivibrio sp. TaxID=2039719 RepID=UPI0032EC18BE